MEMAMVLLGSLRCGMIRGKLDHLLIWSKYPNTKSTDEIYYNYEDIKLKQEAYQMLHVCYVRSMHITLAIQAIIMFITTIF